MSNDLPSLLIGAQGTEQAQKPPHAEMLVVQVNTVAANLRPELTPLGSLATSLLLLCALVLHH
ncbi:hypothetical protein FNU79_17870 [Deinococcus detaillensis]|uniref:Uncharacterized protein n=1 Tax=Deinococcus detaillensis TaxID=2592048 RepID=A0A553UH29_9DEIO|nr:hypothetical protein [Deinococcus detaillensis]TSA79513.1 hypothetical protein FNU79_17870 [Deinococcus detaillensis]